jgi:hypothetical protein
MTVMFVLMSMMWEEYLGYRMIQMWVWVWEWEWE